jgi:electron transfer flavoprotein beta subunit
MRIVVAVKQVPARDSELRIAEPGGNSGWRIDETDLSFEINEPDAYALEEALQLKERHGGEVVAVSAGPARVTQALRETLAKGADRAVHIEREDTAALDALALARLLAAAISAESPDLVLTGLQSDDLGQGQTGVMLAELLGLPHATIVMDVEKLDGSIRVKRELEDGWRQSLELPLPALLTVQSGIHPLRYATLMGIKKARTKEIRTLRATESIGKSEPGPESGVAIDRIYFPARTKHTQLFQGDAQTAAAALLDKLRFEARAL